MNRKYLVNSISREYLCIALQKAGEWEPNNQDSLNNFMTSDANKDTSEHEMITGEYNDNVFFEKWIRNGTNFLFRY